MKKYTVAYREWNGAAEQETVVMAASKADAWAAVAMEPTADGDYVYSAWVVSVQYANGRIQYFNTSEGNAY